MSKKSTKVLASATLMSLVLTTALTAGPAKAAAGSVTRVGGTDRYETAAKVATTNWTTSKNVILVNGLSYADAVSASTLAKKLDAPILLTGADSLNANAKSALDTLKPEKVYIVGGTGAVSQAVENSLSGYSVTRLAGADRYSTNLAVANELVEQGVSKDNLLVVRGDNYPDALSVAPVAAAKGQILLLATNNADALLQGTYDFAKDSNVTVVGTTNGIDDNTYADLKADTRINGGTDRFDTNLKILDAFKDALKNTNLYAATAKPAGATDTAFADALVASAVAGKNSAPLVLLGSSDSDAGALDYIGTKATKTTNLQVVGGTGAVSDATVSAINQKVNPTPVFDGTVTSVETVADQTVNAKADDETLQFTVNGGQKVSVDDLNAEGYTVTFTADKDVFTADPIGSTNLSNTGILSKAKLKTLLGTDDSFKYNVEIRKDGNLVASTSKETVDVISGDETANTISDVTLKDVITGGKITSGKITRSDNVKVDKVKGTLVNGTSDVTVTNVKYYSSDNSIATVDETTGEITVNPANTDGGSFNLIVKSGDSTKEIPLQVVNGTRKASTATASVSSVKIAKESGSTTFSITIKDQYGDAFADKTPNIDNTIKSGDDTIAHVNLGAAATDKDGKIDITVESQSGDSDGKNYLYVKNADSLSILSVPVEVVDEAGSNAWEVKAANEDSKNFLIDLNPQSNDDNATDTLTLNINKLTNSGAILKQDAIKNYTFYIQSQKSDDSQNADSYIKLYESNGTTPLTGNASDGYTASTSIDTNLVIKGASSLAKVGKVTLVVKNTDGSSDNNGTLKNITITTEDTSPVIASSSALKDKTITSGSSVALDDIVDVDKLVLNGSSAYGDGKVRIAKDGTLFIDVKSTGTNATADNAGTPDIDSTVISGYSVNYNPAQDVTVGKIVAYPASGDAAGDLTAASVTSSGTISFTIPANKKGKFTVAVTSVRSNTPIVSKDITVDLTQY